MEISVGKVVCHASKLVGVFKVQRVDHGETELQ